MRWSLLLLATTGCLLVVEPPPFSDCQASDCNGHQCSADGRACEETCAGDDDCLSGWLCTEGTCELPCNAELDCDGYACDEETNRCLEACDYIDDCNEASHFCCRDVFFQRGECRQRRVGECLEDPDLVR